MANTLSVKCNYKLLSELDESLKCLICKGAAEEPWQHGKCGRMFCEKCLEQYGKDKPCYNCMNEQPQYFEDGKGKRDIDSLGVKCKCEWVGTVGSFQKHTKTCKLTLVPCPKHCKDGNNKVCHFMRKDLGEHLDHSCPRRCYTCKYCGKKSNYESQVHESQCKKKVVFCLNPGCFQAMERQAMKQHLETCEHMLVPCKYSKLGCAAKMKAKDLPAHEEGDDKLHLQLALKNALQMRKDCATLKADKMHLQVALEDVLESKRDYITFRSQFYKPSPCFYTGGYHIRVVVGIDLEKDNEEDSDDDDDDDDNYFFSVEVLEGENDDQLNWPLVGKLIIVLLNQEEDKDHIKTEINIRMEDDLKPGDLHDYTEATINVNYDPRKNKRYFKKDIAYWKVCLETPAEKPQLNPAEKPWLKCTGDGLDYNNYESILNLASLAI